MLLATFYVYSNKICVLYMKIVLSLILKFLFLAKQLLQWGKKRYTQFSY